MSEPKPEPVIEYDPKSLRNTIRIALGEQWTKELEDKLFWPISLFCNSGCNRVRKETLAKIHSALGINEQ